MRGLGAVLRRELGGALGSPVAWVATVLSVLVLHAAFFFLGFFCFAGTSLASPLGMIGES